VTVVKAKIDFQVPDPEEGQACLSERMWVIQRPRKEEGIKNQLHSFHLSKA
jgi:hypothetical protein